MTLEVTAAKPKAKSKAKKKRAYTPAENKHNVLRKSNRVCALCWGFHRDGRAKLQGQVAHINRNPEDYREKNLSWLCLYCHDDYDGKKKQSLGIKPAELIHFKTQVEALVNVGQLPSLHSNGGGLITVDLDYAAYIDVQGFETIEVYCLFANEGERATGIKRASLTRSGEKFGEPAFWSNKDRPGPLPRDEYSEDAENLHFLYGQVVDPGRVRRFVINFGAPAFEEIDCSREDIHALFDPPLVLTIEPVLGGPISREIDKLKYRRNFIG